MIGKDSQVYKEASKWTRELTQGVVLCVDPSIGSSSSMPGWALSRAGALVASGVLDIPINKSVPERLRRVANGIRKLYRQYDPDILVYEDIPSQRQGGGNANAHASLLKAVGAILSVPGPSGHIGIMPISWKKLVSPEYVKGDEEDAIEMLRIVIELAERIELEQRPKKRSSK